MGVSLSSPSWTNIGHTRFAAESWVSRTNALRVLVRRFLRGRCARFMARTLTEPGRRAAGFVFPAVFVAPLSYSGGVGVLYLAALILGLGTIMVQLLMGGHGDADGSAGVDHDVDQDVDAHHAGGHGEVDHGFLPIFLSLRFWIFGALAF